jgi:hypothetical protein
MAAAVSTIFIYPVALIKAYQIFVKLSPKGNTESKLYLKACFI